MSKTTTHVITAKSEVLDVRDELSPQELEAVSGGDVYVELFGHKVTSSDERLALWPPGDFR